MPERIQLRRTKGWRKPEGAVVVARPSRWGNPYRIVHDGSFMGEPLYRVVRPVIPAYPDEWYGGQRTREEAVEQAVRMYRRWLVASQIRGMDLVPLLAGHDLACWCPLDQPCHADVLLEIANEEAAG